MQIELEQGCYYIINGTKRILYWSGNEWMKPVKDNRGSYHGWVTFLEKQPKISTVSKVEIEELY